MNSPNDAYEIDAEYQAWLDEEDRIARELMRDTWETPPKSSRTE